MWINKNCIYSRLSVLYVAAIACVLLNSSSSCRAQTIPSNAIIIKLENYHPKAKVEVRLDTTGVFAGKTQKVYFVRKDFFGGYFGFAYYLNSEPIRLKKKNIEGRKIITQDWWESLYFEETGKYHNTPQYAGKWRSLADKIYEKGVEVYMLIESESKGKNVILYPAHLYYDHPYIQNE